ncbi:MAG TPA: hypothetical protein VGR55_13615 [Candidatus Acidoferrum sp.]|nr:hypothetical protein [Candidatus Acidoferrum sp.]
MKKKNQANSANKKVLDGYKKVGTTFVPPLAHNTGPWDFVSWSIQTMPELIWWDVLIDRVSPRFAARVAEGIATYFKTKDKHKCWWAFTSDYAGISPDDMQGLKEHLRGENLLAQLIEGLIDFANLYPECPISRLLDQPPTGIVDISYLQHFEDRMKELEDKRSRSGVLVQAQAIYMGFVLGKLHVRKGLALADFPEVEKYPATELSKQVGASICAAVNGLAGTMLPKYTEDAWVQYFWQRSLDLRPLDFGHLETP